MKKRHMKILAPMLVFFLLLGNVANWANQAEAKSAGIRPLKNKIVKIAAAAPLIINTLDVFNNNSVRSQEVKAGDNNVPVLGFSLKVGQKDLTVKRMTLSGFYDHNGDGVFGPTPGSETLDQKTYFLKDIIDAVKLYDHNGKLLGSPDQLSADGRVTFENLNYPINRNSTAAMYLRVDIDENATAESLSKKMAFDILNEGDVFGENNLGIKNVKVNDGDGNYRDTFQGPNYGKTIVITVKAATEKHIDVINRAIVNDHVVVPGDRNIRSTSFGFRPAAETVIIDRLTIKADYQFTGSGNMTTNPVESLTLRYPSDPQFPDRLDASVTEFTDANGITNFYNFNMIVPRSGSGFLPTQLDMAIKQNAENSIIRLIFVGDETSVFRAYGLDSHEYYDHSSVETVYGTTKTIVHQSKPYYETVSGISNCPQTEIVFGNQSPVYCFRVTADTEGSIDLYKVSLNYRTQGIATGDTGIDPGSGNTGLTGTGSETDPYFRLYDLFDQQNELAEIHINNVHNRIELGFYYPVRIASGQSRYFIIKGPVFRQENGPAPEIRASLLTDWQDISDGRNGNSVRDLYYNAWSDLRDDNHSVFTTDWYNGYALETLPTNELVLRE